MRIGIDVRVADAEEPGQQRYLWRLATSLGARGHDCHVLTVREQPFDIVTPDGVTLERCAALSRKKLRQRVRELELDVLLLNPERSRRYRGLPANLLRSGYGTDHYSQKLRSFRNPLESLARRLLRLAPWVWAERRWERAFYEAYRPPPDVVAQSRYMKEQILASYQVPNDRVHVVHNGVDPEEFSPGRRAELREEARARWSVPEGATCFLFLGHNYRLKGLWQLLEALPALSTEPPVHLLVVGRGTGSGQRRKAARLIRRHGVEHRVTLVGAVPSSIEALAAADALLHLSWHDSFGFVALEAMACGLPVVTTPYVGAAELIEDGASGAIVDPDSLAPLVGAMTRLTDPTVRDRLGAAAAKVARDHTEERNFTAMERIFEIAAERSSGPITG